MRMILGYIPTAIVVIPAIVAVVRQSLYYSGCMDGIEFVMMGFLGFAVGGLLNVGFLLLFQIKRASWLSFPVKWKVNVAKGSVVCAVATLGIQCVLIVLLLWRKMR